MEDIDKTKEALRMDRTAYSFSQTFFGRNTCKSISLYPGPSVWSSASDMASDPQHSLLGDPYGR